MNDRCRRCGDRLAWFVLEINLALFLADLGFAWVSHSRALVGGALQSCANMIASVLVIIGLQFSDKERDPEHPYGYGKVEFLICAAINLLLLCGALFFIFETIWEMATVGPERPPTLLALLPAIVSILANEFMFRYGRCAGEHLRSPALLANAWASRADVVTSCAIMVAVIAANLGWHHADHLIGIFIGVWITRISLTGLELATRGLMDYSPEVETTRIRELVNGVPGVGQIKDVKARWVGRKIWVDLEIGLAPAMLLGEGRKMARRLKEVLLADMVQVGDVTVRLSTASVFEV
jgi:cation diffusion facilitator family transporter